MRQAETAQPAIASVSGDYQSTLRPSPQKQLHKPSRTCDRQRCGPSKVGRLKNATLLMLSPRRLVCNPQGTVRTRVKQAGV